jgi:site-specific recombinase XerD
MSGPILKGVDALVLAPLPSVPATRGIMSKRLADHVHGFLLWMEFARARAANTVKSYGEDLRMFVAFCEKSGILYVDQVTFHHVEAFGAVLRAHLGLRETTIARRYSALRMFFLYLERHDLVPKNPAKLALTMKMPPMPPPNYMTKAERGKILRVLSGRGSRRGRRNYAMFALMFLSGLRVSEVCNLKVEDVDLEGQTLYVRDGKGRKDRRVPIPPRLVRILRLWMTGQRAQSVGADSPWLFLHVWRHRKYNGQPLNTKAVYHVVRNTIMPILGRHITPHTFRHSYGTHIYEESGDLRLAQHLRQCQKTSERIMVAGASGGWCSSSRHGSDGARG